MDFDWYSERLSNLNKFSRDYIKTPKRNLQKRFQIIHESMEMKSVSKIKFGQLNDKSLYFYNGLILLAFEHPYLENLRKEKHKYRAIRTVIQEKKYESLKEESKVIEKIPRLHILTLFLTDLKFQHPIWIALRIFVVQVCAWKHKKW